MSTGQNWEWGRGHRESRNRRGRNSNMFSNSRRPRKYYPSPHKNPINSKTKHKTSYQQPHRNQNQNTLNPYPSYFSPFYPLQKKEEVLPKVESPVSSHSQSSSASENFYFYPFPKQEEEEPLPKVRSYSATGGEEDLSFVSRNPDLAVCNPRIGPTDYLRNPNRTPTAERIPRDPCPETKTYSSTAAASSSTSSSAQLDWIYSQSQSLYGQIPEQPDHVPPPVFYGTPAVGLFPRNSRMNDPRGATASGAPFSFNSFIPSKMGRILRDPLPDPFVLQPPRGSEGPSTVPQYSAYNNLFGFSKPPQNTVPTKVESSSSSRPPVTVVKRINTYNNLPLPQNWKKSSRRKRKR